MMPKINELFNSNYKHFFVSVIGALIVVLFYYIIDNGLKFSNSIEYKDIFTLIVNIIFVMFISRSISKNYDSQRKKKDLLIDEVKFAYTICVNNFNEMKLSNYNSLTNVIFITKMRDELQNIEEILNLAALDIDTNSFFQRMQQIIRVVDRRIYQGIANGSLDDADIDFIDRHERDVRKELFQVIYLINNS